MNRQYKRPKGKRNVFIGVLIFGAVVAVSAVVYDVVSTRNAQTRDLMPSDWGGMEVVTPSPQPESDYTYAVSGNVGQQYENGVGQDYNEPEPTQPPEQTHEGPIIGQHPPAHIMPQVPNIAMNDRDGNEVWLFDFLGKPIVLNFWVSWCEISRDEMRNFETVYNESGDDVHIIKLNLFDHRECRETIEHMLYANGYTMPIFFDDTGMAERLFGVRDVPFTVFIDANGRTVNSRTGFSSATLLRYGINQAIEASQLET